MFVVQWRNGEGERRGRIAPDDTFQAVTPNLKLIFLWLNLKRPLDKRRGQMGLVRRRQLKRSSLSEAMTKNGRQIF